MRSNRFGRLFGLGLIILTLAVVSCSPEATRSRGDGKGADVGNRPPGQTVDLHGTTNPLFGEQTVGKAVSTAR